MLCTELDPAEDPANSELLSRAGAQACLADAESEQTCPVWACSSARRGQEKMDLPQMLGCTNG